MINKEYWAEVITDWNKKEFPQIINRDIKIDFDLDINRVFSLIGPRRAGKTFDLLNIAKQISEKYGKDKTLYINFERPDFGTLTSLDLVLMLKAYYSLFPENSSKKIWLFLDEIQNVKEWETFVRTCLDDGIKVFISGSSSKLLSKEVATSMRGRNLSYSIFPLSFKEFLFFKNFELQKAYSSSEKAQLLNYFENYLNFGGYPEVVLFSSEKEKILRDIFDTAIFRDVLERHKIRNSMLLKNLIRALLSAKEFSVNKFYNYLKSQQIKSSKDALYKYLDYLEDAFFIFKLNKFSLSYKKAERSLPKIYFIDNGILTNNKIDDKGRLLENLVFLELIRRENDVSYHQTPQNEEVDFLIKKGKKVTQLIQVCYDFSNFMTKDREIKSLVNASEEFNCSNLLVLTNSHEEEIKKNGKKVIVKPTWKWLLHK
ncbi:MAG: ATP-binding protein [archaeon]